MHQAARARLRRALRGATVVADELVPHHSASGDIECSVAQAMNPEVSNGLSAAAAPAEVVIKSYNSFELQLSEIFLSRGAGCGWAERVLFRPQGSSSGGSRLAQVRRRAGLSHTSQLCPAGQRAAISRVNVLSESPQSLAHATL
jgi:hypothetical protein